MIPQSQNNPEHLKIINQVMQEMNQNKAAGQPGGPQGFVAPINPLNKERVGIAPLTPEIKILGKTAQ